MLVVGCALPVPRTEIRFNPKTHALDIRSPKNISLTNIVATAPGFSLQIGSYTSENSVEVIRAAHEAQKTQINGSLDAVDKIFEAVGSVK